YLVNELFGRYGLVIVDGDDARLKNLFAPIFEQDIIEKNSHREVNLTNGKLHERGFHTQVFSREVNFFYLGKDFRERIVPWQSEEGMGIEVLHHDLFFNSEQLREEIQCHPERFSPNVIMRPLYQECIL